MSRSMLPLFLITLLSHVAQAQTTAPHVVTRESTVTSTVDRIERSSRAVTLRSAGNIFQTVYLDPSVKAFADLQAGDVIKIRYAESVAVQVRPDAALSDETDLTAEAQKNGNEQVVQRLRSVVKIESIDSQGLSFEYRTKDGSKIARPVTDKRLLEGVHAGDQVEVTVTSERAVSVERVQR